MSKRIYVGNLPFSFGFEELKGLFSKYGEIEDVVVIADKERKRSKGFGFVTFQEDSSADRAVAEMNKKVVEERELIVKEAFEKDSKQ